MGMADQGDKEKALAKLEAVDNPLRLAILTRLSLRPGSAKELSVELRTSIGKVRYQLNRLRKTGLLEVQDERQRRGVSERIYRARLDSISDMEIAQLSGSQREKAIASVLKAVLGDALKALRAGSFAARDDFIAARVPLALDERGWKEAVAVHRRALTEVSAIHESSRARLEAGAPRVADAFSCQLLFPIPQPVRPNS
jgi:DNA-binding transcriptional ArsR family regulator